MSKFTFTSRPPMIWMLTFESSGSTIGRFDSECGAIGTSTKPCNCGCRIGPGDDSA